MKRQATVPLFAILSLCCVIAAAYVPDSCVASLELDLDLHHRSEKCHYFHSGCCSHAENKYLELLRNLVIGLSVAVLCLIVMFMVLVGCCCYCGCLTVGRHPQS